MRHLPGTLLCALVLATPAPAEAEAALLRQRHEQLRPALATSVFGAPLVIQSRQTGDSLQGEVYAVLEHPFARVQAALREPAHWCEMLILPFNTKHCHVAAAPSGVQLQLRIGRKSDQPAAQAQRLQLAWRAVAVGPEYFETRLEAAEGPMGTRDYRISVAAIALSSGQTFLHLSYAYGFGTMGRLAMQAYLSTVGADKVGFTPVGRDAGGQPQYIGGVRGAVERNAMRYYLAIDAYLDSLAAPPGQQREQRIQRWFDASERYPRQLREMDRATYLAMKRQEVVRLGEVIQ